MNVRHVTPHYDLIEHEANGDCICGPNVEVMYTYTTGGPPGPLTPTRGLVFIHHSLYAHVYDAE